MLRWASRILLLLLIVVFSGVSTGLVLVWNQTSRELDAFEQKRLETEKRLEELRRERMAKEAYLRDFLNDPEFLERVVRERLGYVGPGEILFRFDNP